MTNTESVVATTSATATRLALFQQTISSDTALIITAPSHIHYFTLFGFLTPWEREAVLVVTRATATLLYASFSPQPPKSSLVCMPGSSPEKLREYVKELVATEQIDKILIDKSTLFLNEWEAIANLETISFGSIDTQTIWSLRAIKSEFEQSKIRKAASITKQAYATAMSELEAGITEQQLEQKLEQAMRELGAQDLAFPTIVAFGPNSALPHHQPTDAKLTPETVILVDMGARFDGYCADMTRTTWFGESPSDEFKNHEKLVRNAYDSAVAVVAERKELSDKTAVESSAELPAKHTVTKHRVTAKSIDDAARNVISEAGFGSAFIHTTGHGLGLDIHEPPSLNWKNHEEIKPGMVITIEPGIYNEGKFGYRYENTILVTEDGCEELTK